MVARSASGGKRAWKVCRVARWSDQEELLLVRVLTPEPEEFRGHLGKAVEVVRTQESVCR